MGFMIELEDPHRDREVVRPVDVEILCRWVGGEIVAMGGEAEEREGRYQWKKIYKK